MNSDKIALFMLSLLFAPTMWIIVIIKLFVYIPFILNDKINELNHKFNETIDKGRKK